MSSAAAIGWAASGAPPPISTARRAGLGDRAAIGRALIDEAELVRCDEPTSAVDSQLVGLIGDEMKARGTSAIIVTHGARFTHSADRAVHIEDGRISDDWAST